MSVKTVSFDHPQVTATTTWLFGKQRFKCKVLAVRYYNQAGLAAHNDNWYTGALNNGATVVGTLFNTDADGGGASITAATTLDGVLSVTAADLVLAAGDELSLVVTKGGTQTLPYGRIEIDLEVL